jgi:hypothetical protein
LEGRNNRGVIFDGVTGDMAVEIKKMIAEAEEKDLCSGPVVLCRDKA